MGQLPLNRLHDDKSNTMMKDQRLKHYEDQSKAMMRIQRSRDYEDQSEESQVEPSPRIKNKAKATMARSTKQR
jgi:hypothetical protein